jgi:hypothetical protein
MWGRYKHLLDGLQAQIPLSDRVLAPSAERCHVPTGRLALLRKIFDLICRNSYERTGY